MPGRQPSIIAINTGLDLSLPPQLRCKDYDTMRYGSVMVVLSNKCGRSHFALDAIGIALSWAKRNHAFQQELQVCTCSRLASWGTGCTAWAKR